MVSVPPLDSSASLTKPHLYRASSPHLRINGSNWLSPRVSCSSKICKPRSGKALLAGLCVQEMCANWISSEFLSVDVAKGDIIPKSVRVLHIRGGTE